MVPAREEPGVRNQWCLVPHEPEISDARYPSVYMEPGFGS